jgi:hypothetical protein
MFDYKPLATPMVQNLKLTCVEDNNLVDPTLYTPLIGSLMCLVNTRSDIFYLVNTLTLFMVEPHQYHWKDDKLVLRYLRGTIHYSMMYFGDV